MSDPRTDLRDARLQKALAHAPDGDALPAPRTRNTIKNIANSVIPTGARAEFEAQMPWWKTFWEKTGRAGLGGRARGPWNAAFATLLLGGIITLIWQGQPVPDAVPDERPAVAKSAPAAATPAPAVKPPVPIAVPAPAPNGLPLASAPAPAPTSTPMPAPTPEPALAKAPQPRPPSQRRDQTAPEPSRAPVSPAAPTPEPIPAPAAPTADLGVPAESALRREAPAFEKRESSAGGTLSADKSMSDMTTAPQQARTQGGADRRFAFQPAQWTAANVLYQGRTTRLARRDAQNLANRAVALAEANTASSTNANANASAAPKADGDRGAPLLRLQLVDQGNAAAVAQFEVWGSNAFRWRRAGQADVAGMLTPEAVAGLLAEAARTLPP